MNKLRYYNKRSPIKDLKNCAMKTGLNPKE